MKDKIYKYGFLSVCGAVFIITLYLAAYGAVDRAYAFAQWLYHDMPVEVAECSMFASEHLLEVE